MNDYLQKNESNQGLWKNFRNLITQSVEIDGGLKNQIFSTRVRITQWDIFRCHMNVMHAN